jgi:hypothetical protein
MPGLRLSHQQNIFQEKHSMLQPPVRVDDDLTISIKRGMTRLSPGEALQVAERLIRTSTRRMILDEQADIAREQRRD